MPNFLIYLAVVALGLTGLFQIAPLFRFITILPIGQEMLLDALIGIILLMCSAAVFHLWGRDT